MSQDTDQSWGNLERKYSHTVGVVDLGGGSIQMTYAISEIATEKASKISDGDDTYVKEMYLKGGEYFLYVHSTADNPLTGWELILTYHYQLAAHYLKEKRLCLELAPSMIETIGEIDGTAESVFPSIYVGDNYVHRLTQYKTYGNLVELNAHCVYADHGCGSCDCNDDTRISEALLNTRVEVIVNKYNDLLTTQLENQKLHFESLLLEVKEEL
uniref:Uncharacterized protein n=1 Tax=Vitis vinifera TaxID=29760 RepID=F6HGD3_VITVI